jgi:hypothetical protein
MHQIALGHRHHSIVVIDERVTAHLSNTSAGMSRPAAPNIDIQIKNFRVILTLILARTPQSL